MSRAVLGFVQISLWIVAASVLAWPVAARCSHGISTKPPSAHAAKAKPAQFQHGLAGRAAEVDRLQKELAQQEAISKAAAERLQQREHTIAELQQQLHAVQGKPSAAAAQH